MPTAVTHCRSAWSRALGTAEAVWWTLALPVTLRICRVKQLSALETWWSDDPIFARHEATTQRAAAALVTVDRIIRLPGMRRVVTCLPLAMLRTRFLRRQGVPARLHLGIRRQGTGQANQWSGHAWVSVDRTPYGESMEGVAPFLETASFPQTQT